MIGLDNRTGHHPSMTPDDIRRLQAAWRASQEATRALGWGPTHPWVSMPTLARAFGINLRTAWRYVGAELLEVEAAGWVLPFIVWRPGQRPVPLSGARRVAARMIDAA